MNEKKRQLENSYFLDNKRIKIFSDDTLVYDRWSMDTMMTTVGLKADKNHRIEISSDCHQTLVWRLERDQKLVYRSFILEKLKSCKFQAPIIYFDNLKELSLDEGHFSYLDYWREIIQEYPEEIKFEITGYFSKKEKVSHALARVMKAEEYALSKGVSKDKLLVTVIKVHEFHLTPREEMRLELSIQRSGKYD